MNIRRSNENKTVREAVAFCIHWIAFAHAMAAKGFLIAFRWIGEKLARIPWEFRTASAAFLAALILLVSCLYGNTILLMSGCTAIAEPPAEEEVEEEAEIVIDPETEIGEQKLTVSEPDEYFSPGQIGALKRCDLASAVTEIKEAHPDGKIKPDKIMSAFQKRYEVENFNRENLFYSEHHIYKLHEADAFRTLNGFRAVGWVLLGLLLLGAVLSVVSHFVKPLGKIAWYALAAGCTGFGIYWLLLILPMFLLPETLLSMNLKDVDTEFRNIVWFAYLWLWIPTLAFSFFAWFPLYLSRVRKVYGFGLRKMEFGDFWEKNLKCQGQNSGLYKGGYWAFTYHFAILLVIPLLAKGCYQNDSYEIPKGDGGGVVEQVVQIVKPKPKKVRKYTLNPNSAILFEIPKMDDTVSEELDKDTENLYQATQLASMGPGKKGGKPGWPDGMEGGRIRFIRLQYRGGDWDQDMGKGADYNMLLKMHEYAGFNIADNTESMEIARLARWKRGKAPPFVYITGSGNIHINSTEAKQIRRYLLETGGMIFADNGGGNFDRAFRNMLRQILPELQLIDIANDDVIYQAPFAFPNGAPPLFHHSGSRALGLKYNGRWVVFYHQGDINDAWKTGGSGTSAEVQERAYKMGANVIAYSFSQYLALVRQSQLE